MNRRNLLGVCLGAVLGLAVSGGQAEEDSLVVLEVTHFDASKAVLSKRTMTMDELQAMPSAEFETSTIWTEGTHIFKGVWLADLAAFLSITEGEVYLSALNEYLVEFPVDEMERGGPLVAYERDGEPMSPRDKGPLWVVFPYDSDPKYQTESIYAQSIWQMDRIEVYH
ncbi:oxidoreductase [Thalassobius vesicularis]|uniref:Oxidoreductase n=1 Tax=Thalassobius vesicularis TaxID=1294297 RepID=A0A4S3MBR6_9RHOB|nr:oxidoreductase [Thalassobius vesicularis]THD75023.1 oxidoreductase [Thalassobius vesicularis]